LFGFWQIRQQKWVSALTQTDGAAEVSPSLMPAGINRAGSRGGNASVMVAAQEPSWTSSSAFLQISTKFIAISLPFLGLEMIIKCQNLILLAHWPIGMYDSTTRSHCEEVEWKSKIAQNLVNFTLGLRANY
jgi:hypothetical protein